MNIYRDYNGEWKIEGYTELCFTTRDDAQQAAELALYYFIDRYSREMAQESRYRRAASNSTPRAAAE